MKEDNNTTSGVCTSVPINQINQETLTKDLPSDNLPDSGGIDDGRDALKLSLLQRSLEEQLAKECIVDAESIAKITKEKPSSQSMYSLLAENICEEKEDELEVYDDVSEALLKADLTGQERPKDRVYKNSNVEYVNGIPKVKGPIVKVNSEKNHVDFPHYQDPLIDTEEAERIAQNYGARNYESSVSTDYSITSFARPKPMQPDVLSLQTLIPDIENGKMGCSADEIEAGKEFHRENKQQMASQMNVVALYSIKDQTPFYYISSAEARLAIDHINLCRRFKQDVTQTNMTIINDIVLNIDNIINEIKDNHMKDIPGTCVWSNDYMGFESPSGDIEVNPELFGASYVNISKIYRKMYPDHNIKDNSFAKYIENKVEVDRRTIKGADSIIKFHIASNALETYVHYIVCGINSIQLVMNDKSTMGGYRNESRISYPSLMERKNFGIVAFRDSVGGKMGVFLNENIDPDTIVIISKSFHSLNKNDVIVGSYYMDKVSKEIEVKD
ncbi:MAG: hypothetical protein WC119_08830 [Synergistaceae bacterium]